MEQQMCEFCELRPIVFQCQNCKKITLFCSECFTSSHQTDNKKLHGVIKLTPEDFSNLQTNKGTDIENRCALHEEEKKFICKTCELTVCSCCLLIGTHKGHDAILFKEVAEHVKNLHANSLKEYSEVIEKLKGMKAMVVLKDENFKKCNEEAKIAINKGFSEISRIIEIKKEKINKQLEARYNKISMPKKQIEELLVEAEGRKLRIENLLKEASKGITQSAYDKLSSVKIEKSADLVEKISKVASLIDEIVEFEIKPIFGLEKIKEIIDTNIYFEDLEMCTEAKKLEKGWQQIGKWSYNSQCRGVAYDLSTKHIYATDNYDGNVILEYENLDNLVSNKVLRTINIEKGHHGSYFVVHKNLIYYSASGHAQIAEADLSTGKITRILAVPNATTCNGGGQFSSYYYSDIALFIDKFDTALYCMYHDKVNLKSKLCKIVTTDENLKFGENWVIPGKSKCEFGFAFIDSNHIYLGGAKNVLKIDYDFNIKKAKWDDCPNIEISANFGQITHIEITPDRNLIVSDYYNGMYFFKPK